MKKHHKRKKNNAFSMVELLAVVAILGVLSTVALVSVQRIINKSHEEYYKNQEKNLILAAQSYMNDNRSELPKVIGRKTKVSLKTLKESNYLKKDITTYNKKKSCDEEESFVSVFKYGNTNYSYTAFLSCEDNRYDPGPPLGDGPYIKVDWPNANKVRISQAEITIKGEEHDSSVKLISYSYNIAVRENDRFVTLVELGNTEYRGSSITKLINLNKFTLSGDAELKVTVKATNYKGKSVTRVFPKNFKDTDPPTCIIKDVDKPNTQASANRGWVSDSRKITIGCDDGDGVGCEKDSYTKTFTDEGIEGNITIKDNVGRKTTCKVAPYIDRTKPTIKVTAYKCDANLNATGSSVGTTTISSDSTWTSSSLSGNANGWLNKANYPYGVCFVFDVSDGQAIKSADWKWNQSGYKKNQSGYTTLDGGSMSKTYNEGVYKTSEYKKTDSIRHSLSAEGHRRAALTVKDGRGNTTTLTVDMKIDRTPPACPSVVAKSGGTVIAKDTGWSFGKPIDFTFTWSSDTYNWDWYTDSSTNDKTVDGITFKLWGTNNPPSTTTVNISAQGKRSILEVVKDEALNPNDCLQRTYNIDNCDAKAARYNAWSACAANPECGTGSQSRTGTYYSTLNTSHTCGAAPVQTQACAMPKKCEDNPYANQNGKVFPHINNAIAGTGSGGTIYLTVASFSESQDPILNADKTLTFDSYGKVLTLTNEEFQIKQGKFIIKAGTIATSDFKRAAFRINGGTMEMTGGKIYSPYETDEYAGCEAVRVLGGTMKVTNGTIQSGNGKKSGYARGVLVKDGTFTMTGGKIYVNAAKKVWGGTGLNAMGGKATITGGTLQVVHGGPSRCLLCGNGGVIKVKSSNSYLKWGQVVKKGGVVFFLADKDEGSVCVEKSVHLDIDKDNTTYSSGGVKLEQKSC